MSNVIRLHGPEPIEMLEQIKAKHPDAKGLVVIVFDKEGAMWHYLDAQDSQIAWAGARLLHIAGSDLP